MAIGVNAKVMAAAVLGIVCESLGKIMERMLFSLRQKKKKTFAAEKYNNDLQ